jgi:hypothetical protein
VMCSVMTASTVVAVVAGVSGRGTGIPIFGQRGRLEPCTMLRKPLTKRGFRRILLGKGFAPRKGDNYYGHPKTIKRKS